jgi:protein phosphatase
MVRQHNEDACLERPDLGLWVVADGLGGHLAGDVASQMVTSELGAIQTPATSLDDLIDRARARIQDVNGRLHTLSQRHRQLVGSTVVVLFAYGQRGACLWAGDSRLYCHSEGRLNQITTDHTRMQRLIEEGLLPPEEASSEHPASYVVTRALGAQPEIELEERYFDLHGSDTCLLCSDGLLRHVANNELAELLPTDAPGPVAKQLLDMTLARGAADNVTISVVRFSAASNGGGSGVSNDRLGDETRPYRPS